MQQTNNKICIRGSGRFSDRYLGGVSLISPSNLLGFKLQTHNLKSNSNLILQDHKGETYFRLRLWVRSMRKAQRMQTVR